MDTVESFLSLERYQEFVELVETCMDGYLYVLDIERDVYYISQAATERFAIPSNRFSNTGEIFRTFVHKDDIDWMLEDLGKLTAGEKDSHDLDYRWTGKNGESIWINCQGRSVRNEAGKPVFMVGCVEEIGKRQRADNVSGLLGGVAIEMKADALFDNGAEGYCLHFGIDYFHAINESHGIEYGDFILRSVASCISGALLPGQEVYRSMADEYFVISPNGQPETDGRAVYKSVCRNVERFVAENHYEAFFTMSCGAVSAQNLQGLNYTQALKLTQFALSQAKKRGRNQICFFAEEEYQKFVREREILRSIRESVENGFEGFDVHFQPIMERVDDAMPYGAEALLRYRMREGENISPYEFIPILEESGLIIPVGKWVMNRAMDFCVLRRQNHPGFRVNVNVSYVQVQKGNFVDEFFRLLEEHDLDPSSIVIELTESGKVESSPQVHNLWQLLKEEGVTIALDDFGTGFSNLLYISEMTPNIIKLDRSFTVKALSNPFERMLMAHTIQLVHSLGLKVCVEGVETKEELAQVCELGADFVQGYYYSKPCPKEEFMEKF